MSYAFKCDRCGVFFEELKRESTEKWFGIIKEHKLYGKVPLDLCVDCEESLNKWMEEAIDEDSD